MDSKYILELYKGENLALFNFGFLLMIFFTTLQNSELGAKIGGLSISCLGFADDVCSSNGRKSWKFTTPD